MNLHILAMYLLTASGVIFFVVLTLYYYEYAQYLYRKDMNLKNSSREVREKGDTQ